jgi:hypothetical protein
MQEAHCSRRGRQRGAALRHWQRAFGDRVIVPPGTHTTDALFSLRVELEPGTLSCEGHFGVWPRLQAVSVDRAVVPPTSALELFWTLARCMTDMPSCAAELARTPHCCVTRQRLWPPATRTNGWWLNVLVVQLSVNSRDTEPHHRLCTAVLGLATSARALHADA